MSCTYNDHLTHMTYIMAPAYQNHPNGSIISLANTGYNNFSQAMWNGYLNSGCAFWENRINHFTNQLNTQTYSPYNQQIKQAKLNYCLAMRVKCSCPIPPVAPQTNFNPVGQEAKTKEEILEQDLNSANKQLGNVFKYNGEKDKDLENEQDV
jgi:hypothetical protein